MRTIVLLGPQRFVPTLSDTVRSLGIEGSIATVTAGWREREPDDGELDELLDGRSRNLGLYARWLDLGHQDPAFAEADRRHRELLEELQSVYVLRLHHALESIYELQRKAGDEQVVEGALDDAIATVRAIDERHLERVRGAREEFWSHWPPRDALAEHRAAVAHELGEADLVAVAGGHVGELLACLQVFDVGAALGDKPVVAWSAGAMAIAERVVLFHDLSAHGRGHAEVLDAGLGLCRGTVLLPHARRRLLIDDRDRMAVLARRFAPATCVVLEDGARVDCPDGTCQPPDTAVVRTDGTLAPAA